jgi:hypothetical protein
LKLSNKKSALEQQMAQIEKELKSIEKSTAFKRENAISRSLNSLMKKHGCSKNDLITLLQEGSSAPAKRGRKPATKSTRKPRMLKVYKNPTTGETVETRGGNHKVLKAWKLEYKTANIEDWVIETKS